MSVPIRQSPRLAEKAAAAALIAEREAFKAAMVARIREHTHGHAQRPCLCRHAIQQGHC